MVANNNIIKHYEKLVEEDIYAQPPDPGHADMAREAIDWAYQIMGTPPERVVDLGCGQGFCRTIFEAKGTMWWGVTLGPDYSSFPEGANVIKADITLGLDKVKEGAHDLLFARHVLEHSPCAILTLMEWHRIASEWMLLVAPSPEYWGWTGRNHYSMMAYPHLSGLLQRAGWQSIAEFHLLDNNAIFMRNHKDVIPSHRAVEYWMLCKKV